MSADSNLLALRELDLRTDSEKRAEEILLRVCPDLGILIGEEKVRAIVKETAALLDKALKKELPLDD